MNKKIKKWLPEIVGALLLVGAAFGLLGRDVWVFLTWWLLAVLLGMVAMPFTGKLFAGFDDRGWMFSKVLAIAVTGFLTWFLVSVKLLPFTTLTCVGVTVLCGIVCFFLFNRQQKTGTEVFPVDHMHLVCREELLFFAMFLLWTYLAGFRPEAYGTEKFMDYGFMEAMMRSTTLPARDIWYSEGHINYYYGGQYFAVFLTKLSGSRVEMTYNLMRTFVAGLAFVLPFSLTYQMMRDRLQKGSSKGMRAVPALTGILAGAAVSLAGNMHYVIYSKIIPWIQKLTGEQVSGYWFPDATRYIGYNPDVNDKTIHEFPCYSFVLGDLHAHVVNVMFVLLVTGLLYAWLKTLRSQKKKRMSMKTGEYLKKQLLSPHILLVSVLLGMFQWTNFWDFVIYYVVTGGVVLFANIILLDGRWKQIILVTAAQAAEILLLSYVVILPFTLQFETMVQGVALAQNHSRLYQLLVLWGLPVFLTVLLIVRVMWEKRKRFKRGIAGFLASISLPDLFAVITGLCAMGLVLIPELVYVRDIYENGYARANTMFKLTYQAFILFGITMGYGIFRLFSIVRKKTVKVLTALALFCLLWTVGYFGNAVNAWFGDVTDIHGYQGLNALAFLDTDFAEDADAIRWLKKNVEGSPVVLEANGDSYTGYERVSAATGLPTILGWKVHEWLWRSDVEDLNEKSADIETIYTSSDEKTVRALLEEYEVSYIFVGFFEREKYGENLNNELIKSLGNVVYESDEYETYIVQVAGSSH